MPGITVGSAESYQPLCFLILLHFFMFSVFQDVHVMIFIGFGFLMTFLKRYGYSAVGINMVIAGFVIQWHMLFSGFLHLHNGKISINITR